MRLTTTRRVRNSALEVGLLYDSDLSRSLEGDFKLYVIEVEIRMVGIEI